MGKRIINRATIKEHYERIKSNGWLKHFKAAADQKDVRLDILLAIASQETDARNIRGDGGHGRGLMQIDDRYHQTFLRNNQEGMDVETNVEYAAALLANNIAYFKGSYEQGIAAYNCGPGNVSKAVKKGYSPDTYTTKHATVLPDGK